MRGGGKWDKSNAEGGISQMPSPLVACLDSLYVRINWPSLFLHPYHHSDLYEAIATININQIVPNHTEFRHRDLEEDICKSYRLHARVGLRPEIIDQRKTTKKKINNN